jgi:hypothetical protein
VNAFLRNNLTPEVKLQILDASGRVVDQYATPAGTGFNVFTMQRDDLPSGTYFIRVLVREQSFTGSMYITR